MTTAVAPSLQSELVELETQLFALIEGAIGDAAEAAAPADLPPKPAVRLVDLASPDPDSSRTS